MCSTKPPCRKKTVFNFLTLKQFIMTLAVEAIRGTTHLRSRCRYIYDTSSLFLNEVCDKGVLQCICLSVDIRRIPPTW